MSRHAYTKGPWEWTFREFGGVMLQTPDRGKLVVMDFSRKGMNSAEPRFAVMDDDQPRGRRGGILCSASELSKEHGDLAHPDALVIRAAPDLAEALQALTDWHEWSLEQSERAADEFYRETGMLAPFKDFAAAANEPSNMREVSNQRWREWYSAKNDSLITAARAALKRAGVE